MSNLINNQVFYDAAGGVVIYENKILLLDRPKYNEIRLPKGHIEMNESCKDAAIREVQEESGYINLYIIANLGNKLVSYVNNGYKITRNMYFFLMGLHDLKTIPRAKEELQFIPIWKSYEDAYKILTFESEKVFVKRALSFIRRPNV